MRLLKNGLKGLGLAALLMLAGSYAAVAATECEDACLEQFQADRKACEDAYQARLAQLDGLEAQCRNSAKDPISIARCIHKVNVKRRAAANDLRKCYNRANTKAFACLRACNATESRP